MKKVIVRAPVRADLAGGTLDLWPVYLFHPGARTVNVALSYYAESEVIESSDGAIEIHLTDENYRQRYESLQELAGDPKAALIHRALEHFHLNGVRITTRTDAPRGSGLGGSSALAISLVRAFSELTGSPIDGEDLIHLVRDLETRLIGIPAGIQDYYPAVYGGLAALHLNPGALRRHEIPIPLEDLSAHMLLYYSGVAHFSGTNNWQIYKRQLEGKKKVQKGLSKIAAAAAEMERALEAGDFAGAGRALAAEWKERKAIIEGISNTEIDAAMAAALGAGAWAGKVCGAGGGGSVIFLFPPERREDITRALSGLTGRILDAAPVPHGLSVDRGEEVQESLFLPHGRRTPRRGADSIEQLYVYGGTGPYRPYVMAEGVVTHNEPRSGVHDTNVRAYLAPIAADAGKVLWQDATRIEPEDLDMRAVPEPSHRMILDATPEALELIVEQAADGFRQFLTERERLQIFHNPSFALYSEAHESRDAFVARCLEEADRQLAEQSERVESTYRRRVDQLREKSEREQRELEANDEVLHDERGPEVGVAWGQALYNITSGRPATAAEASHSLREVDYIENIAQIQRAWDKERDALRDELTSRARSIETLEIAPKDIEIAKYVILWAAR